MGKLSRNKGAAGEREFCKRLAGELQEHGVDYHLSRNLKQTRDGGYDIDGLDELAIEVKRAKKPALESWWTQCVIQSYQSKRIPVLAYRLDNQKWRVRMHVKHLAPADTVRTANDSIQYTVEMGLELFAELVAEKLKGMEGQAA